MHVYDADFYRYQAAGSLRSARLVVAALGRRLPLAVRSVLDLGCGDAHQTSLCCSTGGRQGGRADSRRGGAG